ncbi:MAG: EutN/CcmL family microcompartment protein [Cloacibacillus evryensis]
MKVARVIGNIWATRKEQKLSGFTLLILQRIDITTGQDDGAPIVAVDLIGAGCGEMVILSEEARRAAPRATCQSPWTPRWWR